MPRPTGTGRPGQQAFYLTYRIVSRKTSLLPADIFEQDNAAAAHIVHCQSGTHGVGTVGIEHGQDVYKRQALDMWYGWPYTTSLNCVPDSLVLNSDIPWVDADGERLSLIHI